MGDNHQDDIAKVVALIGKIAGDAYRRGQDDALQRIVVAAKGELAGHGQFTATATMQHGSANGADGSPQRRPGGQPGMKRATRGSVRKYVHQVLTDPHYQGATWEGIFDLVAKLGGTDIAPASVRNYLRSSEKRGEMRRQNGLWFLSEPPWAREGENRAAPQPGDSQSQ
jgi:hypothetical protein